MKITEGQLEIENKVILDERDLGGLFCTKWREPEGRKEIGSIQKTNGGRDDM